MAKLPVYNSQGNITTNTPGTIRNAKDYSGLAMSLEATNKKVMEFSQQWQKSKDEVENLDGKNKMLMGYSNVLKEAEDFSDWSTPAELEAKRQELTQKLNGILPEVMSGFSNNQNASIFQKQGEFTAYQNQVKLDEIFRNKYQDMANSNLLTSQNENYKNFAITGSENYKQSYFNDIDAMVNAGFLSKEDAIKEKLSTDSWNYDYVYSKLLDNPYFKADEKIMSKIPATKQKTLTNLQRSLIRSAKADALNSALNDFYVNPTQENLNIVYKLNPKLKESAKLENLITMPANMETVSNIEGYADASIRIKELASINTDTIEGKEEYIRKASEIALKIDENNKNASGSERISLKDKEKLLDILTKKLSDNTFKEQFRNLPDLNGLKAIEIQNKITDSRIKNWGKEITKENLITQKQDKETIKKLRDDETDLEFIKRRTAEAVLDYASIGDFENAHKTYKAGLEKAIRTKYWYIPELQNDNLQAGTKFTVNGKVYTFQGYSSKDMIVEVN